MGLSSLRCPLASAFLFHSCRSYYSATSVRHLRSPSSNFFWTTNLPSYRITARHCASTSSALSDPSDTAILRAMPRGVKKENLPSKVCVVCGRPFTWRKKWERVWDEVTTCSKSCNRKRKNKNKNELSGDTLATVKAGEEFSVLRPTIVNNAGGIVAVDSDRDADEQVGNEAEMLQNYPDLETEWSRSSSSLTDTIINEKQFPSEFITDTIMDAKAQRKAEKKRKKAERRAQREGRGDPTAGQKSCTICAKSVDLLIRCTPDSS